MKISVVMSSLLREAQSLGIISVEELKAGAFIDSMAMLSGGPKKSDFKDADGNFDRDAWRAAYYEWKNSSESSSTEETSRDSLEWAKKIDAFLSSICEWKNSTHRDVDPSSKIDGHGDRYHMPGDHSGYSSSIEAIEFRPTEKKVVMYTGRGLIYKKLQFTHLDTLYEKLTDYFEEGAKPSRPDIGTAGSRLPSEAHEFWQSNNQ